MHCSCCRQAFADTCANPGASPTCRTTTALPCSYCIMGTPLVANIGIRRDGSSLPGVPDQVTLRKVQPAGAVPPDNKLQPAGVVVSKPVWGMFPPCYRPLHANARTSPCPRSCVRPSFAGSATLARPGWPICRVWWPGWPLACAGGRSGAASEVLAALRKLSIGLLCAAGWTNVAAGLRYNAWRRPDAAIQLLSLTAPRN